MMDEDLLALEQLEEEERQLVEAKARALEAALQQSSRESERCLEAVRRALPELDLVSKTAGELRQSIHKTMERADVVSVKVRELDLSRSRALEALEYSKKCVEARTFVRMARQALADREVEVAAGYVQRFDELASTTASNNKTKKREQFGQAGEEMLEIRNELERSILFAKDTGSTHHQQNSPTQLQAIADNWLESSAIKEALKHANVMSKVASEDSSAEVRYAHFLASFLKDRMQAYLAKQHNALAQDDKAYIEAFKFLFNSSCALIQSQLAMRILAKRAKPHIFKHIHAECDKQCTQLFDSFMTARRVHERAAGGAAPQTADLQKLNHLLTEICIIMQHVESYDRFTKSLDLPEPPTTYVQPEYKRVIQEVAGAYTMLERNWLTESLKRAKQAEQIVEITTTGGEDGAVLQVSSFVEDAFYLCKRAVKRGLGTGSADAACGCINQVAGCLEDTLSFTALQQPNDGGGAIQVNSLEISSQYCLELNQQILHSMQRTFERAEELAKTRGCAEGLVDLSVKLQRTRVTVLQQLLQPTFATWESATFTEALKRASYDTVNEQHAMSTSSEFVERWVAQMPMIQQKFGVEMSEQSFQLCVELVAQRVAEDVEKGIVTKDFTQLGALQFEHDLREIIDAIAQISINSFTVRAMFTRLLQITSLLGISTLGEAHDVWDSFSAQKPPSGMTIKPRERLTSNLAKRILTRRTDFKQKDVDKLKLL